MGCLGDREKGDELLKIEQRWDYINLDEFKTKSCLTPFAYCWGWLMLIVSVSIYAVDTFTAINLIAFDKWSGQIQPAIPFSIARWIFAGCIIASFVLLFYRWWRAIRVMKQGGVAKSYLDPLAARIQCIRMGKEGRGYKRFLVFAELTKSRKGADYVALFAYFSFEAWLRIIFAEGPRQAVNAITLFSVMNAEFIPKGDHDTPVGKSPFVQFWLNVGAMADQDKLQAAILLGMLWSLVIWVLAAISLAVSVILFLIFLWHHIPKEDGGLANYCRKKINRRMERVVQRKVTKALKKENELRSREEAKAERDGIKLKTQPTLPDITADKMEYAPSFLSRQDTMTTLPEYESRADSIRTNDDEVPPMRGPFNDALRPGPKRHGTQRSDTSWSSYNSDVPLMRSAGEMGMQTPVSATSGTWPSRGPPQRSATGFSQFTDRTVTPAPRPPTAQSGHSYRMEPMSRPDIGASNGPYGSRSGPELDMPPMRSQTPGSGHTASSANGSYFPPYPGDYQNDQSPFAPGSGRSFNYQDSGLRSMTPSGPPPRSQTPGGPPSQRSFTPNAPPPPRSYTPNMPPPRSFTPQGPPQNRPTMPYDQPTLPSIDINTSTNVGHMPTDQRSGMPAPSQSLNYSQYQNQNHSQPYPQTQEYRSFSRPRGPAQQNSTEHRESGVDDILNHY